VDSGRLTTGSGEKPPSLPSSLKCDESSSSSLCIIAGVERDCSSVCKAQENLNEKQLIKECGQPLDTQCLCG